MEGIDTDLQGFKTDSTKRKPRVVLMGEFSAGKSTLSNLLIGDDPLPVRITATNLPPVWLSYGEEAATLTRNDDTEEVLKIEELSDATLEKAKLVRLSLPAEILKICDLIDMPGISDPNLEHDVWNDLIDEADCVIWCTHATQAWRQSEASAWDEIRGRTNGNNLLLVTQYDKLKSENDRARVLARLGKETNGAFKAIFPVSLIQALKAEDDEQTWKLSGADEFVRFFVDMLLSPPASSNGTTSLHVVRSEANHTPLLQVHEVSEEPKIQPKRVSNKPGARPRTRPVIATCSISAPQWQPEAQACGD